MDTTPPKRQALGVALGLLAYALVVGAGMAMLAYGLLVEVSK